MKAYLKGYYWYKNFWDELLLLGLLNWIQVNLNIEELIVEVADKTRIDQRLTQNQSFLSETKTKIITVSLWTWFSKKITQIKKILGFCKYKHYFKIFGWWEVLNFERNILHAGFNLGFMYNYSIRKRNFMLVGGITKAKTNFQKRLYKFILPRAQQIILREKSSYDYVNQFLASVNKSRFSNFKEGQQIQSVRLYQDFSKDILESAKKQLAIAQQPSTESKAYHRYDWAKDSIKDVTAKAIDFFKTGKVKDSSDNVKEKIDDSKKHNYIIINITSHILHSDSIQKLKLFIEEHSDSEKYFFPWDTKDDIKVFNLLQKDYPDLKLYDWTNYPLLETLSFIYKAKAWLAARLHLLFPLKVFWVPFQALVYKDKVRKLILVS